MESKSNTAPLIVILGETASGKSALAMKLACKFHGEIIAADSRTVYRGMDIGTAKPSQVDRQVIRHHLIDVASPSDNFTVKDFKRLANLAIADVQSRHKLPILVGGSGLYIDAVLYDFSFRPMADPNTRDFLQQQSIEALQSMILQRHLQMPTNSQNPRHLIRTIEANGLYPRHSTLRPNTFIIGLAIDLKTLRHMVEQRVDAMVAAGLVQEVEGLAADFGWDAPALQATGYKAFRKYVLGEISLDEAKKHFVQNDMQYAKRQRTWFRRNKSIHWIRKQAEAVDLVTTFLSK